MHFLYKMQKICGGSLMRNMCYMLCDISVMRIALMCKEARLYARGTYLILVSILYQGAHQGVHQGAH